MLPVASAQIKSCVLLAGLLAEGATTVVEPEPSRDHTERLLARAGAGIAPRRATASPSTSQDELRARDDPRPGRPVVGRVPRRRGGARARLAARAWRGWRRNWTRVGFFRILERMGAVRRSATSRTRATAAADAEPLCELDVAHGPLRRHARDRRRGPAGDRRAAARRAARLLRRGRDRRARAPQELRLKESDRIATVVDGLRGAGRRHRGDRGRLRRARHRRAARRHARTRTATTGWRCSARSPACASREGVEVVGMEAAAVSYPRLHGRSRADADRLACRPRHGHRHRRPRRGREVHRRPRRRRARWASRTSTPGRCTAASRCSRPSAAASRPSSPRRATIELGERVLLDGRDVTEAIRTPAVSEAASRVERRPRRARWRSCASSRRCSREGDWVAEGRDIGTVVVPGRRGQGVPHRVARGPRARAARRSSARTSSRCSPSSASATSATSGASTRR